MWESYWTGLIFTIGSALLIGISCFKDKIYLTLTRMAKKIFSYLTFTLISLLFMPGGRHPLLMDILR